MSFIINPSRFAVSGGGSAPTYVGYGQANSGDSLVASLAVPVPAGNVGDLLVAFLHGGQFGGGTWDTETGWTRFTLNSQTNCVTAIYWKIDSGTGGGTVTFDNSASSQRSCGIMVRLRGTHATTPINDSDVVLVSTDITAWAVPDLVTTVDNCFSLYFGAMYNAGTSGSSFSPGTGGYTEIYEVQNATFHHTTFGYGPTLTTAGTYGFTLNRVQVAGTQIGNAHHVAIAPA